MKIRLPLLLPIWILLLTVTTAWGQVPTIISPANNAVGLLENNLSVTARSNSTGNTPPNDPEIINIEIATDAGFTNSSASNDFERSVDTQADYIDAFSGLSVATDYYIRAISDKWGPGPSIKVTTRGQPVTGTARLDKVGGVTANTTGSALTCFANTRRYSMTLNASITNATFYIWQFDSVSTAFTNISDSIITYGNITGTSLINAADSMRFRSGKTYFVRVRGANPGNYGGWGNLRKYANALHPCQLVSPTGTVDRYSFKLWTAAVSNATRYYFQVSTDPSFSTYYSMSGGMAVHNTTVSGITGNVFGDNYTLGNGRAFNYLSQLSTVNYYVRVRPYNSNQNGYWSTVRTVSPLPVLTSGFLNVTNNQANIPVSFGFAFRDDPYYFDNKWDFQLSRNSNFSLPDVDQTNNTTRYYYAQALLYNTTYYARVRSYENGNATPSAWVSVSFTTQALPNLVVRSPANGGQITNTNTYFYSNWEGSVDQYQWQLERLTAPVGSYSATAAVYGTNFPAFLQRGKSYRVRVRGYSGAQSITGNWSSWVNFTTAPPAGPVARPQVAAQIVDNARSGAPESGTLAYPNPFLQRIRITADADLDRLTVTDLSGRFIETNTLTQGYADLGDSWPRGVYLITLTGPTRKERLRVVKE